MIAIIDNIINIIANFLFISYPVLPSQEFPVIKIAMLNKS